jgi:hypothetical protein
MSNIKPKIYAEGKDLRKQRCFLNVAVPKPRLKLTRKLLKPYFRAAVQLYLESSLNFYWLLARSQPKSPTEKVLEHCAA